MGKYGDLPKVIDVIDVQFTEMMFYQYLPIKLQGQTELKMEQRLLFLDRIIGTAACDFVGNFGLNRYIDSYVYLTVKHQYVSPNFHFNRLGWHSDGFMTDDVNYIWSNKIPTVFNASEFLLPMDDVESMKCMEQQAKPENDWIYGDNALLKLNEFNIHRVGDVSEVCLRAFVKISFSKDKYDLLGNSKNYLLDYAWEMKPRKQERNIPQSSLTK
jgi:hypothetical protein